MPKPKESLTITPVDDPGNPHFIIKGSTLAIKNALREGGAIWQDKRLEWLINGATIPKSIQDAIGEAYGMYGLPKHPAAGKEAHKPVRVDPRLRYAHADTKTKVQSGLWSEVYAIKDINYGFGEYIVKAGTKGKVEAGGESRVGVRFEGFGKTVMCDWNQVTTDAPEAASDEPEIMTTVLGPKPKVEKYPIRKFEPIPDEEKDTRFKATHNATFFHEDGKVECGAGYFVGSEFVPSQPWSLYTPEQWDSRQAKLKELKEKLNTPPSFKVGQFVKHKTLTHVTGVIGSIYGETAMVNVTSYATGADGFEAAQYRLIDLESRDYQLPMRQVEFMQAIRDGQPVVKNAATRAALRRYGMITNTVDWDKTELTPAGIGWWENFGPGSKAVEPTVKETVTLPEPEVDYSIEARYGVEQGDDWMKWNVCHICGVCLDGDVQIHQVGLGDICDACLGDKNKPVAKRDKPQEAPKQPEPAPIATTAEKPLKSAFEGKPKAAPLRQQYLEIKRQYPDCILFYRLGDFYETFDQDAETIARELDLVLTGRPVSKTERVPMAGVPHHALEQYIEMLLKKGYTVAVAEQVGEPIGALVERKVERVIKPPSAEEPVAAAPAWTKKLIVVKTHLDDMNTEADVYGQLAVHPIRLSNRWSMDAWTLTHIASGGAVVRTSTDKTKLFRLAEQLKDYDFDKYWADVQSGTVNTAFKEQVEAIVSGKPATVSPIGETVDDERVAEALGELAEAVAL